ncbi:tripartite motif-containing protein 2-like [Argopecten irradians]|uniref:tripartite motif-containing protein 2-like n=1 Tax=Argopecten irradians TaxID=31199 RepID=UPI00371E7482
MAEGGGADNQIAVKGDRSGQNIDIDPRLIECPICLEQLRHPKSLPCLHTFCEECLNIYIAQEADKLATSFPCPLCRLETVPMDPKEKKENWAKQFPTNNFIIEVSKECPPESKRHGCDPCKLKKISERVEAKVWWKESNRFLCGNCLKHLKGFIGSDLTLVDVTSGQRLLPKTTSACTYCPKHNKEMDLFCEDHQSVCCATCVAVAHRRCEEVTTLSEYGDKIRSSTELQDMRSGLQQVAADMKSFTEYIKNKTNHLGDEKDAVLQEMTDFRKRFEARLDRLQRDITNEVVTTYKEEKHKLDDMLHKCERMYNGIKRTQALSENEVIKNDDMQMVSVLQRGTMEVKSCKDIMQHTAKSLITVKMDLDLDDEFRMAEEALIHGRINITKTKSKIPLKYLSIRPLSIAEVKKVGKLCIKTASDQHRCHATGLLYLPDADIIVVDGGNNKVKIFKESGELVDELRLETNPWDLCLIDKTTLAVTMQSKQLIKIIRLKSSKLHMDPDSEIKTGKPCNGMTYNGGQYILTAALSQEVYSLEKHGSKVQILSKLTSYPYYVAYDQTSDDAVFSLYTSKEDDTVVYRLSSDGTTTEMAKVGLLKNGNGVDVDEEGNVYVCGRASNNVVQISRNGRVRELLKSKEPLTLSFCANRFILSNAATNTSNYITIYESF